MKTRKIGERFELRKARKIGERFDYGERTLEVVEADASCRGCFFENLPWCDGIHKVTGPCFPLRRVDKKWVIFKLIS